ncbi:hypothetical protein OAI45_05115 [Planktomarina temperata]|nr:hypothetical protein [Planktomarina temperata]
MSNRTKKFSEELDELIREGEFLAMAIEYDCKPEQFRRCYIKVFKDDDEKLEAFIKKLPRVRKVTDFQNYTIRDYLKGLMVTRYSGSEVVADGSAVLAP